MEESDFVSLIRPAVAKTHLLARDRDPSDEHSGFNHSQWSPQQAGEPRYG